MKFLKNWKQHLWHTFYFVGIFLWGAKQNGFLWRGAHWSVLPKKGKTMQNAKKPKKIVRLTLIDALIPLRAKRVGEFIEIRHKKISPTSILSTLECL